MNSKLTTNSQLSTKLKKKIQTKQTTRIGTEPQKWRSHRGLSIGEKEGESGGKATENKQHKWQVENRQGEVKNRIGNVEAKERIHMTHGHELKGQGNAGWGVGRRGIKGRTKWDNCNSIINKIYLKIKKVHNKVKKILTKINS